MVKSRFHLATLTTKVVMEDAVVGLEGCQPAHKDERRGNGSVMTTYQKTFRVPCHVYDSGMTARG